MTTSAASPEQAAGAAAVDAARPEGAIGGDELRYEAKFSGAESELPTILGWIRLHPAGFRSPFPDRRVNNLYFETWSWRALAANIEGESNRTKLRYRWYGESLGPGAGSLEVKRRWNGQGWKLRFPVPEAPWRAGASWRDVRAALAAQLPADGRAWLAGFPLPALLNRYQRRYFVSRDGLVRLTLDWRLEALDQRFQATPGFHRRANLPPMLVVEGKCGPAERGAMARALQGIPLRVSRSSKYVTGLRIASGT